MHRPCRKEESETTIGKKGLFSFRWWFQTPPPYMTTWGGLGPGRGGWSVFQLRPASLCAAQVEPIWGTLLRTSKLTSTVCLFGLPRAWSGWHTWLLQLRHFYPEKDIDTRQFFPFKIGGWWLQTTPCPNYAWKGSSIFRSDPRVLENPLLGGVKLPYMAKSIPKVLGKSVKFFPKKTEYKIVRKSLSPPRRNQIE